MSDLERELRDMLRERATDIRSVPDGLLTLDAGARPIDDETDAEVLDLGLRRTDVLAAARRRWPLLVAAAVVLAVGAGLLSTLTGGPSQVNRPATHSSAPAKPVPTVRRTTCPVADPAQWNAAVRAASFVPGGIDASGVSVDGVTPEGSTVVSYNRPDDPAGSIGSDLGVLASGSRNVRRLGYFGSSAHRGSVGFSLNVDVDTASDTAVVSPDYEVNGKSSTISAIYSVDLVTGHRTLLTTSARYPNDSEVLPGVIQDSVVYWQVNAGNEGAQRVYAVAATGGTPRLVGRGAVESLSKSALGIGWGVGTEINRPRTVPAAVRRSTYSNLYASFPTAVTDGTAYAWTGAYGTLSWYSPQTGKIITFPRLIGTSLDQGFLNAVAGPLVYFQNKAGTGQIVLDTRTGALVHITTGGSLLGNFHGSAVGDPLLDGPAPTSGKIMRLDTSSLAPLRC